MPNAYFAPPPPTNEPVRSYAPGSPERASLKRRLAEMREEHVTISAVIGGERVQTGRTVEVVAPHEHSRVLATAHLCGKDEVARAIDAARAAADDWRRMDWADRAAIFLKAADLLAGPMRDTLNAATMLGQSKNVYQAEIDSACELIDFLRFNVHFASQMYAEQPVSSDGVWNRTDYRPLEGFVLAVTPFNFTAIQANLPAAPAMLGNVVLWKPSSTSLLSAHYVMELFEQAGLPPGVINLLPGKGADVGEPALASEHLAGLHFTGSTGTFQNLWQTIGRGIADYRTYPRIVGETGGKDFILAHPSADAQTVATAIVRGAFEYQGQKCSAASRVYVPRSLWEGVRASIGDQLGRITVGPVEDFSHFVNAVIDKRSFDKITGYIDYAAQSSDAEVIFGGTYSDEVGYFIDPTVILTENPHFKTMREEIFGPVVTIYVYDDAKWEETMTLVDETSPYALTGAVFARERSILARASERLVHAAGNFYLNDKPTGAVVGQQPFGGGRASGTNDKAGSLLNLTRWVSPRSIKENFAPPTDFVYPFLAPDEGAI
jgi:1-pyrroline-5-carboxylate dehydrogenase